MRGDKLVKLECDPMHFALLLTLLNKTRETDPYSWDELASIIKLGATYGFIHMPELVHPWATRCLDECNATIIFQFAGAYEYADLAKFVIPMLAKTDLGYFDANELPLSFYDKIAPRYAAALAIAISQHPYRPGEDMCERWQHISAAFQVYDGSSVSQTVNRYGLADFTVAASSVALVGSMSRLSGLRDVHAPLHETNMTIRPRQTRFAVLASGKTQVGSFDYPPSSFETGSLQVSTLDSEADVWVSYHRARPSRVPFRRRARITPETEHRQSMVSPSRMSYSPWL